MQSPTPPSNTEVLNSTSGTENHSDDLVLDPLEQAPVTKEPEPQAQVDIEAVSFANMPALEFDGDPHNVTITSPITSPGQGMFPDSLDLPSAANATQEKLLSTFPNLKEMKNRDDIRWAQTVMQSMPMVPAAAGMDGAFSREGSDWHQTVEINGDHLRSKTPRFKTVSKSEVSGEQGLQMAFTHMGMGDFFHAGMWNSGFWVTFKPAPEAVWLNINRILGQDVTGVSRQTYGMLHSTATALAVSTIINSILPYVYGTSVNNNEMPVSDIPKYLSNHDEHDFIWGFIAANYPHGVSIDRSCIIDPNTCRAVIKEKLNITEMQVIDRSMLPEKARQHMRERRLGLVSLNAVKEYQALIQASVDQVVTLKGSSGAEAKITFSVPSSETKARMSNGYIDDIQESILATVTADTPADQREALYERLMTATELRLYQHWVKKIELTDDRDNAIVDPDTIAKTLGVWTRDVHLRDQFFKAIAKFIDNTSLSGIGMTPAKCPSCGGDHTRPEQRLRGKIDYIPLDIIQVFSYLAEYKTRLVSVRA